MELVYLAGCELYSIPLAVLHHLNLTYLISLDLQGNGFNSGIPLWLSHMTYLTNLHLAGNYFYGPFPNFLSKLTSLTVLGIFSNGLSNSIPNSLCYMSSLVTLYLHFNHFQGSLPNCIGNLSSLKELNLDFNKISGNLPTECFVLSFCTWTKTSSLMGIFHHHCKTWKGSKFLILEEMDCRDLYRQGAVLSY